MKLLSIAAVAAFALGVSGFFSGCSSSSGGDNGHVTADAFDPALCTTLQPETGGPADASQINVRAPVVSDFFEKRYNRPYLLGVLTASDLETQKYSSKAGTQVYKIPYKGEQKRCLFQHALPAAPEGIRKTWEANGGVDTGGPGLDGLFIGRAIMVREEASRWTLVHEMTHDNFYRQRKTDGFNQDDTTNDAALSLIKDEYTNFKNDKDPVHLTQAGGSAVMAAKSVYRTLSNHDLEEIAVESLLLQEFDAGRLKFVSMDSVGNAAWYIGYSRKQSLGDLSSLDGTFAQMQADATIANLQDTIADLQKARDFITSVNKRTQELADTAKDIANRAALNADLTAAASVFVAVSPLALEHRDTAHIDQIDNDAEMKALRKTLLQLKM